jgi:glycosyltransferase involved in cell wall biosynthesis
MTAVLQEKLKKISILICSKNRRRMLESLVLELRQLNSDFTVEIVVVEETDTGDPIEGVNYVSHPLAHRGIGYARNLALKNASSDFLVFLDDDCKVSQDWLQKLIQPLLADDGVLGVQGGVTVPALSNTIGWAETLLGFPGGGLKRIIEAEGKWQETRNVSTLNCVYRRSSIEQVGGFDESLASGGEDNLLANMICRHGRCTFAPEAVVTHEPRGYLRKIWGWFVNRGRSDVELIQTRKLKQANAINLLRGSLSGKILALGLALFFASYVIPLSLLVPSALILYFKFQMLRYYKVWRRSRCGLSVLLTIPIVKITMDIAADYGRLQRLTFG